MRAIRLAAATALLAGLVGAPALAADHEVLMLNRGADGPMAFEPALLHIQPGETVRFVATDRSHNAESIAGMAPEGAESFKGAINEEIEVTFEIEGVYGYECKPHYAMGMIGLIVVGEPTNLEEVKAIRHRGRALQRFDALFDALEG